MRITIARVRFPAIEVLALLDLAATQGFDELWLVRGRGCRFYTPDMKASVAPVAVDGDRALLADVHPAARVEVLGLHNHVLRTLHKMGSVDPRLYLDLQITEEEEYCLSLCDGRREIVRTQPFTWMLNITRGGLFHG